MNTYKVEYWDRHNEKIQAVVDAYTENEATQTAIAHLREHGCSPSIFISCKQVETRQSAENAHKLTIDNLMDQLRDNPTWMGICRIAYSLRARVRDTDLQFEIDCLIDTAEKIHVDNILELHAKGKN